MCSSGGDSADEIENINCDISSLSSTNMEHLQASGDTRPRAGPSVSPSTAASICRHEYEDHNAEESIDSSSGEGPSRRRMIRKRHRHTPVQISALEASFNECSHPNEERRKLLSAQSGLTERQVKFWFQNKRNSLKSQKERQEILNLKEENERFKEEKVRMTHILQKFCPICEPPPELSPEGHRLMTENKLIKEKIEHQMALIGTYFAQQGLPIPDAMQIEDATKYATMHSAITELTELMKHAEPLWISSPYRLIEKLNEAEYVKHFSGTPLIQPRVPGRINYEGTRVTDVVMFDCLKTIEIIMNPVKHTTFFPSLVSATKLVQVICKPYQDNYHRAIQMMTMECHSLSPLVPRRKCTFLRYCQWNGLVWVIVDVSVTPEENQDIRTIRRPSGCILQEVSQNMTKVTWIEHVEVDDYSGTSTMYQQAVKSGIVFGARRWVSSLKRQSELVANINSTPINSAAHLDNKRCVFTVAARMIKSFFNGITGTNNAGWSTYSGTGTEHDIKITSRINASDPGKPYDGAVLCASASFWLPVPIARAFDILIREAIHSEAEAFSLRGSGAKATSTPVARGRHRFDSIYIDHLAGGEISTKFLRQSFFDPMGAYIIYSPIERVRTQIMVPIHPSGFVVVPNSTGDRSKQGQPGSLVTVAYQITLGTENLDAHSIPPAAIAKVRELVVGSCRRMKASVSVPVNLKLSVGSSVV